MFSFGSVLYSFALYSLAVGFIGGIILGYKLGYFGRAWLHSIIYNVIIFFLLYTLYGLIVTEGFSSILILLASLLPFHIIPLVVSSAVGSIIGILLYKTRKQTHFMNLYSLFQSRILISTAPFLMNEDRILYNYSDMDFISAQYAALLKSKNVKKGDRVLVQVEKSPESVFLYLACLRIGAVYLPLNPAYTENEVNYFIEDATPALIVQDMESFALEAKDIAPHHDIEKVEKDDLAATLYTSGTTGRSKGAMLSHHNLASNALTLHKIWAWREGDVLLHALPIFHVHGLFVALHCALLNGSPIWFLPKFDVEVLIRLIPRSTVLMGVPTFYTRLLDHPDFTKELCKKMRLFISGSAPLLSETFERFHERTGQKILERYGMTEAGMITSNPYEGHRIAGTVGPALPDVQCRIADSVLEIKGPNVFKGYWQMPEKTAEEFREDGFFITGDMAEMDADGRVTIIGRAKDLIISGGLNIYPKEIESAIDQIPGVLESAVIGVPDADLGEVVVALVVRKDNSLNEDSLLESLKTDLAKFKQPRKIIFLDALPRNTMGKVQKNSLRLDYS